MSSGRGPIFYKMRLAKGACVSVAKVWRGFPTDPDTFEVLTERPFIWRAVLNGEDVPIETVMIEFDPAGVPVIKGDRCDEIEYLRLTETHLLAREHSLPWPEATPRKAIDLNRLEPIKW